ncbi:MAG: tetratricopeptide repeat protein, partial [Myxococcales bacterium]|nr:tetratricopeptide repeat protein [Myxococcales bacterium]
MSLFKKILGTESWEELRTKADKLFESADYGPAKLLYERAAARAGSGAPDASESLRARMVECCDRIADERIAEAQRYLDAGDFDFARNELDGALEVTSSEARVARARELAGEIERREAAGQTMAESTSLSADEQLVLLASTWEEAQAAEYEAVGDTFTDALVAIVQAVEHHDDARDAGSLAGVDTFDRALETLVAEVARQGDDAVYSHFELGRAYLLGGNREAGESSLRRFLERLPASSAGDARLLAHLELARLRDAAGDSDGAMGEFERAVSDMPNDPRPFFALGQYLRRQGLPAEAADVLESALAVAGEGPPDWRVLEELGLAQRECNRPDAAVEHLEAVVTFFTDRRHFDIPVAAGTALAALYAADGRPARAADSHRLLAG